MVDELMDARRAVAAAMRTKDDVALKTARVVVDRTKVALGERGPPWWEDGDPDLNRRMARTTPYAGWYAALNFGSDDRL